MEANILERMLAEEFNASPAKEVDFVFNDGPMRIAAEVKLRQQGARQIRESLIKIASYVASHEGLVDQAYVFIALRRIGPSRVRHEWKSAMRALKPDIARRLRLVAAVGCEVVVEPPNDPRANELAQRFCRIVERLDGPQETHEGHAGKVRSRRIGAQSGSPPWKRLETEKVLLSRWILNQGPIAIGALQGQVGCSYPTVQRAIFDLTESGMVERGARRSVRLTKYPRDRWANLIAMQNNVYPTLEFADPTNSSGAPSKLLERLNRMKPSQAPSVALGGVEAARGWTPSFNLNGLPRIDLVIHSPDTRAWGAIAQDYVRRLDPGLIPREGEHKYRSATLAIHPLFRKASLFRPSLSHGLHQADPVETIVQLHQMGLTEQAEDMLAYLRSNTRKE
ncbi:MAG: hypothetical protein HN350_20775 [Phycisphaerales bacterium]|jgi:hypothetical protein|nr:hypothetical protein [Phycisphaerales bacterium]